MFINFWYPAMQSEELGAAPSHVRMLGMDFALFRDAAGRAHCLANTCVHRGGSLGHGKVKGDCIECPYHGWRFDQDGVCRRIPSIGRDGKIPARAKVDSYPVEEKYGLIFVFLGDLPEAERPPIREILEWDDDKWRATIVSWEFDANMERAVENSLDPSHNEFVHATHGFQGEREDYKVPDMEITREELGVYFRIVLYSPALDRGELKGMKDEESAMEAFSGHHGPNQLWNRLHLTAENWLHQYQFCTPIDENRTRFWHINMRNSWLDPKVDEGVNERNRVTSAEDQVILTKLRPVVPPAHTNEELLMPSDETVLLYRSFLSQWEACGWRIDVDAMKELQKTSAVTVPSPARREQKNWVLKTVPLIAPSPDQSQAAGGVAG